MTRTLILGSSHVGAIKRADTAFRARFPDVETDYFATKAPMLRRGKVEDMVFRPYLHDDADAELLKTLNGRTEVDLAPYDKVLVVGFRAHPLAVTDLFKDHVMLGDAADDHAQLVSKGFVQDWLKQMARDWAQDILSRFGDAQGCVFTPGPYPAESLAQRAGEMNLATRFKAFCENAHAAMLFEIWSGALADTAADLGLGYLAQPADSLAGPYATKAEFAQDGTDADGALLSQGDHRHMNADFGLMILEQFAIQHLDQHPLS